MKYTRQHYNEMAEMLAGEYAIVTNPVAKRAVANVIRMMADILKKDNFDGFDRERFYAKCGLNG